MQLTASRDGPGIGRVGILHAQRHVALELPIQSLPNLTRRDELPLASGKRRIVHEKIDRDCRLLDRDAFESVRMLDVGDCQSDLDILEARERDDLAARAFSISIRSSPSNAYNFVTRD